MSWNPDAIPSLQGRTAVVTGANSGIGLETARILADHGARVVLACRNLESADAAAADIRGDTHTMPLDLASLASVRRFADAFGRAFGELDILVNNAGVMVPPLGRTEDGFELQFGTNHLGHFALTALLYPLIEGRPGSRIVNVSSVAHRRGRIDFDNLNAERSYNRLRAYGQSKLANLLFTLELDRRLRAARAETKCLAAHPGWTATNLQKHMGWIHYLNGPFAMSPARGCLSSVRAATDPEVEGGEYFGPTGLNDFWGDPKPARRTRRARDSEVARRLWERSEELTGVSFTV